MPDYLSVVLVEYGGNLTAAIIKAMLVPVIWQGGLLAGLGFILSLIGGTLKDQQKINPVSNLIKYRMALAILYFF